MGVCVDTGPGSVSYVLQVASSSVSTVGECNAACPAGHQCIALGSGELLPPELDPTSVVGALGAGMTVIGIPLAAAWAFAVVLSLLRR